MAGKAEALAKQYESKVQEATGVFDRLSDADWKKTTSEKWTVGCVAHHVAGGHEGISGIIKTVAGGQSVPNFTMDMLHDMNAKHAKGVRERLQGRDDRAAQEERRDRGRGRARAERRRSRQERNRSHRDAADERRADHPRHSSQPRRGAPQEHPRRRRRLRHRRARLRLDR